ncbi:hypothetical protein DMC30DRAFT_120566 [Rhodotorula diobovata]|uniref:Uncharacterized protein n=1 Tax=Rhodotorula diobovata TaxID=5288 RepID=A0A5C5FKS9_9BASI|nr:hypothetical protein DMC30DRAFT_120566 [Rhodotorula diobovata]
MLQSSLKRAARTHRTVCAAPQRTLWRCSTLISSSPTSLLSHLEEAQTADADSTLTAYALSKNTPQELVPRFVAALSSSSSSSPSIGCLSEVVPPSTLARLAPSAPLKGELYTVAIARHRPSSPTSSERAIPFRSTLTGRPNIALGREIKPEMRHDGEDAGFEAFLRGEKWGFGERANEGRAVSEGIDELKHVDPADVKELVAFTADRMQPFLAALSTYPSAATTGLVGTSTPFHSPTGAPFSLFFSNEVVSSGAIGVAVVGSPSAPAIKLDYGGLEHVGEPYEVTSSQGNIVLSLSNQNAARLLLDAVNKLFGTSAERLGAVQRSEEKDKEFFAALYDEQPSLPLDLGKARLVAKIMAGDPSRGAMSVETEQEVATGSYLAFLHAPSSSSSTTSSTSAPPPSANSLTFLSLPASDLPPRFAASDAPSSGPVVEVPAFVAASENGVLFAPPGRDAQGQVRVCAVEGASARVEEA